MNVNEYLPLIKDKLIDYIRVHMSDIGGLTPMRKLAALCEYFCVRTALHGPGDWCACQQQQQQRRRGNVQGALLWTPRG